jgi:hypothetical protein
LCQHASFDIISKEACGWSHLVKFVSNSRANETSFASYACSFDHVERGSRYAASTPGHETGTARPKTGIAVVCVCAGQEEHVEISDAFK